MRSIGIDPGDQTVKVVELDGSYKKTRLVRVHVAPSGPSSDAGVRADTVAAAARAAFDDGMKGDVTLGHPCREAVLRTIEMPFKGHDAIRKVVKAEIEGEIQSQSVDDMVVDFHEIGEGLGGGTRILVASVPKPGLRTQLDALRAQNIEPEHIDLDTMALWRAAHWAGAFEGDDDGADADKSVTAVVDIGARSVKIVLVEGEHLVEMRALRLGESAVADDVARRNGIDAQLAREAVVQCLTTGADQHLEVPVELPVAVPGEEAPAEPAPEPRQVVVPHEEVAAAHAAYVQRLARELTRFLTASGRASKLRAVWCTGGGIRLPGTREMLASVFGVEAQELDMLARLQHELPPEQAAELQSTLTNAIGLALGRLGGPAGFELRREDLVLARGFERIKFPLAIACMVAWLTLFVLGNKKSVELRNLELQIGQTYVNKDPKAPTVFYGMLNAVFSMAWFDDANHFRLEHAKGRDYTYKDLIDDLMKNPVHKRIAIVRDRLKAVADQKQKDSGIYEDVSLESGLAVLVRWAELIKMVEPELKGMLVTKVDLNMKSPKRRLEFTVAFRGEDFRTKRSLLQRAIDAELAKTDSPFEIGEADERKDEDIFKSEDGGVPGAYFRVTLHVKDGFEPFGPSGNASLGAGDRPARPADTEPRDRLAKEGQR